MEYRMMQLNNPEIVTFFDEIFEIYQIRGRIGNLNGIKFEVRTKETCHNTPHVHAEYGEFEISIEIETGKVLAGNLPNKNTKLATDWVLKNRDKLLNDWKNIAISSMSNMTKSNLTNR